MPARGESAAVALDDRGASSTQDACRAIDARKACAAVSRLRSRHEIEQPWVGLPLSLVGGVALNALKPPDAPSFERLGSPDASTILHTTSDRGITQPNKGVAGTNAAEKLGSLSLPVREHNTTKRGTTLLSDPGQQVQPPYGMIRIHPSRVIEFAGNPLPDWRLAPMRGGWGASVQTLHRMMEAILRGWPYGGALIVFPASVMDMGFRVMS
jgi:hypothetical protein